jgi:hypothetical protein
MVKIHELRNKLKDHLKSMIYIDLKMIRNPKMISDAEALLTKDCGLCNSLETFFVWYTTYLMR